MLLLLLCCCYYCCSIVVVLLVVMLLLSFVLLCYPCRFMGRGVIDLPMEVIIRYLELYERRKEWDRYMVVSFLVIKLY